MSADKFTYHPTKPWGGDRLGFWDDYQSQLATFNSRKTEDIKIVEPGHEVSLDTVLSKTKAGKWNTQSTLGKLVVLLEELGGEIKIGVSRYEKSGEEYKFVWLEAVVNRKHVELVGSEIWVQGTKMKFDEAERVLRGE